MKNISEPRPIARGPAMSPSGLGDGALSPLTLGLVSCGGIGALLFTATYLIEGITRPGYDAWRQPVSSLSLGPGGWVQQVNFVVFGLLTVLSAVGWYRVLAQGRNAIWFPLFQYLGGLCLIGAGVFSIDPFAGYPPGADPGTSTAHGTLHTLFAWAIILSLAAGCFAMGDQFAHVVHWRGWAAYSWGTGVLILLFWYLFVQGASGTLAGLVPIVGLIERLSTGSHALWICLLTATLLVRHRLRSRSTADGKS